MWYYRDTPTPIIASSWRAAEAAALRVTIKPSSNVIVRPWQWLNEGCGLVAGPPDQGFGENGGGLHG